MVGDARDPGGGWPSVAVMTTGALLAEVTADPIDSHALAALVGSGAMGAVVTFVGVVRDHDTPGRGQVSRLDYEAHPQAAEVMLAVCRQVAASHPETAIAAVHRIGPLAVGEPALVVAVAAPHRAAAFDAASEVVDTVKARLPVWKHQLFADGSDEWVGLGTTPAME